jgi:hypothetical protein
LSAIAVDATSVYVGYYPTSSAVPALFAIPIGPTLAPSNQLALASGNQGTGVISIAVGGGSIYWIPTALDAYVSSSKTNTAIVGFKSGHMWSDVVAMGSTLFYLDYYAGNDGSGSALMKVAADGSSAPTTVVANLTQPHHLRPFGDRLYWSNEGSVVGKGSIQSIGVSGGSPSTVYSGTNPVAEVADATDVYFLDGPDHPSLRRQALSGGASTVLYTSTNAPKDLAIDDRYVYLVEGGNDTGTGKLLRFAKSDGSMVTLLEQLDFPSAIATDDASLFIEEAYSVIRLAR